MTQFIHFFVHQTERAVQQVVQDELNAAVVNNNLEELEEIIKKSEDYIPLVSNTAMENMVERLMEGDNKAASLRNVKLRKDQVRCCFYFLCR